MKITLLKILLSLTLPFVVSASVAETVPSLSATQIVDKNLEARGGAQAWRAVHTMSFSGKLGAGGKQNTQLPFLLKLKRPRKSRVEIEFENNKAIQVYDGVQGWKLRPYLGRKDVEPFSPDELKAASMESDLDGPLIDHDAKGTRVDLDGIDKVEGNDAYKLKLTASDGKVRSLWVDAKTFLEVKIEGVPRRMDGRTRSVEIYYRDYRNVSGLMVPYVLETTVEGVKQSHKMTIENVVVNAKLDDSQFREPNGK